MGIDANEVYRGDFIKANSDGTINIDGNPTNPILTLIDDFSEQEFPDGKKQIVCAFKETGMTLGLNGGNMREIMNFTGSSKTDKWVGLKIQLTAVRDDSGKSKTGKRIIVNVPRDQGRPTVADTADIPKLGKEAGNRLIAALELQKDRGFTMGDLIAILRLGGCGPDDVLNGHPESWPRLWAPAIKKWLDAPIKAIKEEDIPF